MQCRCSCSVSFELAATVFIDRLAVSIHDLEHSENEERWVTLGKADNEQLLVMAHTYQETSAQAAIIRIISARAATRKMLISRYG